VLITKYYSGNQIEKKVMRRAYSTYWGKRGAYWILVLRPEGQRPFGRSRHRWEDNIKMDLQSVGWGIAWIEVAQNSDRGRALVNAVMKDRVL
jgi:hypothetical protein